MHGGPSAWTRAPDSDAITLADATLGATLRVRRDARIMGSAVMHDGIRYVCVRARRRAAL